MQNEEFCNKLYHIFSWLSRFHVIYFLTLVGQLLRVVSISCIRISISSEAVL